MTDKPAWSCWRQFPDPSSGGYLSAPFGPGVYELRDRARDKFVLFGRSKNVACRMSSILPSPLGAGTRNNTCKRKYVLERLTDIDYRTMACADVEAAKKEEEILRSSKEYLFHEKPKKRSRQHADCEK